MTDKQKLGTLFIVIIAMFISLILISANRTSTQETIRQNAIDAAEIQHRLDREYQCAAVGGDACRKR